MTRGPQVFAGYIDANQTRDAFHEGWLRTGDLCRIDADGYVEIMGRVKDVIIRGGHNIDPRAIEDAAMEFPGVALAAAVGRPDSYAGEVPMLFVSVQPGVTIDPQELGAFVSERILEPPARPRAVEIIADMPLTPIGKIFKPRLREIASAGAARDLLAAEGFCRCHRHGGDRSNDRPARDGNGGGRCREGEAIARKTACPHRGQFGLIAPASSKPGTVRHRHCSGINDAGCRGPAAQ